MPREPAASRHLGGNARAQAKLSTSGRNPDVTHLGAARVEHLCRDPSGPDDGQVMPDLRLVNNGTESVPYSELTIRYWFTRDTVSDLAGACDYAWPVVCNDITWSFTPVVPARSGADYYFEVGFTTGAQLAPAAAQNAMQLRFYKTSWANFSESNDHSYNAFTSYTPSPVITVYRNGELIWGVEP